MVEIVTFSADKTLDLHVTLFQYHLVFLKFNGAIEILNKVVLRHY